MELDALRNRINDIDSQIIALFVERMRTAAEIAEKKAEKNLPVLDTRREKAVLQRVSSQAGEEFSAYAAKLYQTMFDVSRSYQAELMNGRNAAFTQEPFSLKRKEENT